MKKIKDINTALSFFVEAATKHAEATEQGDYKTANKNYDVIERVVAFLKAENTLDSLLNLLNSSSIGVRLWAATYILPLYEKEGINVLKEIAKQKGIHSLTAETTISEWEKGNLKL